MKKQILFLLSLFGLFIFVNQAFAQNATDCDPISTFPYTEGFENSATEFPPCWKPEHIEQEWKWEKVLYDAGTPPTTPEGYFKMYIGMKGYGADVYYHSKLFTPVFDLSEIDEPVLSFWHAEYERGSLLVYYKNSIDGHWIDLQMFQETNWQKEMIPLPEKSNYYQIAFEGWHPGGSSYGEVHLDKFSISGGVLSVLAKPVKKYTLFPNPVQDYVTIQGIQPQKIILYDYQGKTVFTQTGNLNKINMLHLPEGFYLLKIITDAGVVFMDKIIKQ